jgi:uncharacterized delta-60 repeat protein
MVELETILSNLAKPMKQFGSRGLRNLFGSAGFAKLGLVVLAGLLVNAAWAQPANDYYTNAINLTSYGDTGTTNGSNVGATIEPGEQRIDIDTVVSSVWYKWTASTNETTEFDPNGSAFGTNLAFVQVFTNSGSGITNLKFVTDSYYGSFDGTPYNATNSFQAVAGRTYYISVAGYQYQSATGSIQLNWSSGPPLTAPANDAFASATVLTGDWGSTNVNNSLATHEPNEPSHAGFPANASVWYQWTAPVDGEVELDTIGSQVDTVLAVYTGNSLATLSQVAANDDLIPINSSDPQYNENDSADYIGSRGGSESENDPTYYGPSGLRFNAKGGTTYYFAVDTKSGQQGVISLNWAYKSSGVFRFATEDVDDSTGLPLYQTAQTESATPQGLNNSSLSVVSTYYSYNAPGVLVTVTRAAGSSGRVMVDYATEDGTALPAMPPNDVAAIAGEDYEPVSGTLVFDDFEMSKTILIPIIYSGFFGSGGDINNTVFGVVLSNPRPDLYESADVSQPRLDPNFSTAMVKILNVNADPYGPDMVQVVSTNGFLDPPTNSMPNVVTNLVISPYPTNAIFNFEKANYRVPEDVNDPANSTPRTVVTLWVERFGTNTTAQTLNYRVDNFLEDDQDVDEGANALFPLQPGSDYAVPPQAIQNIFRGTNSDFNMAQGTLSFPGSGPGEAYQSITFTVTNSTLTKFNKDFRIVLYQEKSVGGVTVPRLDGMVAQTTVTILFNDQHPPAGSVDELYNADFNGDLALPPSQVPQTYPENNLENPGVSGEVYSLAVLTNDETIIGGDFLSYNGVGQNDIALVKTNGALDGSFNPDGGASAAINAVAIDGNQFIIGGDFTAFDGNGCGHFARVNADGSVDLPFSTEQGSGADNTVRAVAVQPDGKVLIGGDFTMVDGISRNYLARLNTNGTLDTTFDPGTTLSGPVYALALPPSVVLNLNRTANGGPNEDDQTVNLGNVTSGILTVNYNMFSVPDDMRIFYGDTNVTAGTGVQIYDTGYTNGAATIVLPFGPINGLTTNLITIVMNQGGSTNATTAWTYNASVSVPQSNEGILVGGQFNVAGQAYANIARFTANGVLDTTFNPGTGMDSRVLALGWQLNNQIVAGGVFTHVNGSTFNHIVRLNQDGSLGTNFFVGSGADNVVYSITINQLDGTMYVGGAFASFNGTHRLGFTRLYSNGTVDTTFMDTAYNQFAGLKRIYSDDSPAVFTSGVQSDGNVLIGGSFDQVGGGQADTNVCDVLDDELSVNSGLNIAESFDDPYLWVEPKSRDGVRNRSSIARLIGGATPGPGNVGLLQNSFSANKSQSALSVGLVRTNGMLGPVSANFSVVPGLAQSGVDYVYDSTPPLYWIAWEYRTDPQETRQHSDGLSGINGFLVDPFGISLNNSVAEALLNNLSKVTVSIIKNPATSGNLNAQFQLANPSYADNFFLGGENIPLGGALGVSSAPYTEIDDTQIPGTFGFSSASFVATNASAVISVLRSNGLYGTVSMKYSTSDGTAVVGTDYTGITNQNLVFNQNVTSNGFNVAIKNNGFIYTNIQEKTVNLQLSNLGTTPGATFGISNAVLRLINPNYQGYLTLSATNYNGTVSSGSMTFIVNRVAGSLGSVSVQYATTDGSAFSGTNYIGATNTLSWNSGDVSPKIITIPLLNPGVVGPDKQFSVSLFNPTNSSVGSAPSLLASGVISNATLTIINDNSSGSLQFSAPTYTVNENGGYATLTIVRTGGDTGTLSAHYATSDGTATNGVNYTTVSGSVTLASGQISTNFIVQILDDGVADPPPASFYFNVSLVGPGTSAKAVVQIVDAETYNRPPGSPDAGFNSAGMNGSVFALALQTNGQIIAGGNFTAVGSVPEGGIARLNTDGTLDTAFLSGMSGANGPVLAVVSQTDGHILLGGSFTSVDNVHRNFISRLNTDGSLDSTFNPGLGADNTVNALAETFVGGVRKIYIGGAFGSISGSYSPGFARLNNDGSADTSFATGSGADGSVYAIAVYPTNSIYAGKVLIGGTFTHFDGTAISRLARLNADGSVDTNFDANLGVGPSDAVRAIAIQLDGRVLVGGSFTNFNGAAVNYITRLNADGTRDTNFTANTSDSVESITLQPDNRIVLAGQFAVANGVTRQHITRLLPSGATDPTINFGDGANGDVDTVIVQPADGMLVIGGSFSQYDDQPHANIARIYGSSITGSGAFEFTSANYQVDETGVYAVITIRRTGGTSGKDPDGSGDIFVNFVTSDGTAKSNVNYTPVNLNVDFPAGEVLEQVTIPVFDDFVITNNLTVNLALSNPTPPAGIGDQPAATLTILNDDSAVSFKSAFYSQLKNVPNGMATIDIIRQGGTNSAASVDFYTTTNGTAIAGTDYIPTSMTVTFNPGVTDVVAQVPIINNGLPEGNQTVGLLLTNAVNTLLYAPSNATLTIVDTTPAPGQFSFSATNYVASEGDGVANLTVVRTNGFSGAVTVGYYTVPGTAQPGVNYTAVSGTLTFNSGDATKTIAVPLVNNNLVQGTVSLSVVLTNVSSGGTLIAPTNATLSILDNDTGFIFANATNYVREINGFVPIFVERVGNTNSSIYVNYATADGTARARVNYNTISGQLNFGVGQTVEAISLPLIYDTQVTGDLTMLMSLSNPSAGTVIGSPSNTVVVIQDADAGLSFTNSTFSVPKNFNNAVITVVCSNPSVEPVLVNTNVVPLSVNYSTADGTGTNGALAGTDYTPVSGTLVFTNGIGTNTFNVPILNNSLVNGNRNFTVSLSHPTAPGQLVPPSTQTVTIVDYNSGLNFSSANYSILKTGIAATITVWRTDNTNTTTSVNFATADGTAVAGTDYFATNGTIVFTNGETVKTFSVPVVDTTMVQPDKTVLLQLSNPTNGILIAPYAATLTIHDTSGSLVVPAGSAFAPGGDPNNNGLIDPGENVALLFALRASGGTNVTSLNATLLATNGITSPSGAQNYGTLTVGGPSVSRPFSFTASGTNSQTIAATFKLQSGANNLGTAVFTYTLGMWTNTFSNTNIIFINDDTIASPYPSAINVSNIGGTVIKATITLTNLSHTSPADIDALLVSPAPGTQQPFLQDTLIMGHAGGGNAINNVTLTFDDAASNSLPHFGLITSGTNKPTAYLPVPPFP